MGAVVTADADAKFAFGPEQPDQVQRQAGGTRREGQGCAVGLDLARETRIVPAAVLSVARPSVVQPQDISHHNQSNREGSGPRPPEQEHHTREDKEDEQGFPGEVFRRTHGRSIPV